MGKICFCLDKLSLGGSAQVVFDLVMEFSKLNYQIDLILFYNDFSSKYKKIFELPNVRVHFLNKHKGIDLKFVYKLKRTLQKIKPSVISSHLTCTFYLALVSKSKNTLIFHTIHSLPDFDLPKWMRFFLKRKIKSGRIKLIGCSEYIASLASTLYGVNVEFANNGIVPPIDTLNKDDKYYDFCSIGRFVNNKRFLELLSAFVLVVKVNPRARLCIGGVGDEKKAIEDFIESNSLTMNVDVISPALSVKDIYSTSRFYITHSEREGFPITILEAMSMKLPIIAADLPNYKNILNDQNSFLFKVGDLNKSASLMIKSLEITDKQYQNMQQESYKIALKYNSKDMTMMYLNIFKKYL